MQSEQGWANKARVLSRKAQLINCWLVSWGKIESNMGMDIKIDPFMSVIIYVISFHVQDLFPLIILSNLKTSFLFSSNTI